MSYPQLFENAVSTVCDISLICPRSLQDFFNNTGKKAYTAFYTLILFPWSNIYLTILNRFLIICVLPLLNKSTKALL